MTLEPPGALALAETDPLFGLVSWGFHILACHQDVDS